MFLTFQKSSSDLDACITLYLAFVSTQWGAGDQILGFWTLMGLEHRWFNCKIVLSVCEAFDQTLEKAPRLSINQLFSNSEAAMLSTRPCWPVTSPSREQQCPILKLCRIACIDYSLPWGCFSVGRAESSVNIKSKDPLAYMLVLICPSSTLEFQVWKNKSRRGFGDKTACRLAFNDD